jgi:hypothetical protein
MALVVTTARTALPVLAATLLVLVWWSWGKWLDPLVDFGRELYLPWQITEGRVLYRDLASFNGPLSPYANALWFTIGGASLRTIVAANSALALLLAWLLFALFRRFSTPAVALTAALVFVLGFSVSHTVLTGNYNFITPYSHELTHGMILTVAAFLLLAAHAEGAGWAIGAAGFVAGAIALTKVEVAAAAWLGLGVTMATRHRQQSLPVRASLRDWTMFATGAAAAMASAMLLFALVLPLEEAMRAPLTAWTLLLRPGVSSALVSLPFYRAVTGTTDWTSSLLAMGGWSAAFTGLFAAMIALGRLTGRAGRPVFPSEAIFIIAAASAIALRLFVDDRPARPLPLLTVVLAGLFFYGIFLRRRGGPGAALQLGWIVFSGALLAKIGLNPRLSHYGFVLALPALLNAVVVLLYWLPERVGPAGARAIRATTLALLAVMLTAVMWLTSANFGRKTIPVGRGADAFLADRRGIEINAVLAALARTKADTLAVLPEGAMLNYLARIPSPVPYVNFMPPELIIFGEQAMARALAARPPRLVILAHKDTTEFGYPRFGRDYGQRLAGWISSHYRRVERFGSEPLVGETFGILLMAAESSPAPMNPSLGR